MSTEGHVPVYVTEDERDGNVAIHKINKTSMVGIVKWLRPRVVAPVYVGSNPTTHPIKLNNCNDVGVSPSGKATDSDSVIRRFESYYPSQFI